VHVKNLRTPVVWELQAQGVDLGSPIEHSHYFASISICDKWVPVTSEWGVLRLRMEDRPPIWRVAANILNKQSRTVDKGWSSLGVGRGAENSSP